MSRSFRTCPTDCLTPWAVSASTNPARNRVRRANGAATAALVAFVLFVSVPKGAAAQSSPPPGATTRPRVSPADIGPGLYDGVVLTAAQIKAIEAAAATVRAKVAPTMTRLAPGALPAGADLTALNLITQEHSTAIRALLTAEQRARVDANLRAAQERRAAQTSATGAQ